MVVAARKQGLVERRSGGERRVGPKRAGVFGVWLDRTRSLLIPEKPLLHELEITNLLRTKPAIVPLSQIQEAYRSMRPDTEESRLATGCDLIARAYEYAQEQFEELAGRNPEKKYRKDGETPYFAHSSRVSIMMAYLGAESEIAAVELLHDLVEDCGVAIDEIRKRFGDRIALMVSLLTEPRIIESQSGIEVITLANEPDRWMGLRKQKVPSSWYPLKMKLQYDLILNANARGITGKMKAQVFLGKMCDGLDNLQTDMHLNPRKARIRHTTLIEQIRHLEVLSPELRRLFIRLLRDREYNLPSRRESRMVPKEAVIELAPPETHLSVGYLDAYPEPGTCCIVYSADTTILDALEAGTHRGKIKVEFPHHAPEDIREELHAWLVTEKLTDLGVRDGRSLLPETIQSSGKIVWISGISDVETYQRFVASLTAFEMSRIRSAGERAHLGRLGML